MDFPSNFVVLFLQGAFEKLSSSVVFHSLFFKLAKYFWGLFVSIRIQIELIAFVDLTDEC